MGVQQLSSMLEYYNVLNKEKKLFKYISSGVCLINLDQARKHDYVHQAVLLMNIKFHHISSFVNYLGYDGIGYIPVKYHVGRGIFTHDIKRMPNMYPDNEI